MTWLKQAGLISVDENELARLRKIEELARQITMYGVNDIYLDELRRALDGR